MCDKCNSNPPESGAEMYIRESKSYVPLEEQTIRNAGIKSDSNVDRVNIREHLERVHKDFDYLRDRVNLLLEKIGPVLNEQREQTPVPAVSKPEVTSLVATSLSGLDSQIMTLAYQVEYITSQVDL